MNYYKVHGINPDDLKNDFIKYLHLSEKTSNGIAQSLGLQSATLDRFLANPNLIHYKSVLRIHKWIQAEKERYKQGAVL